MTPFKKALLKLIYTSLLVFIASSSYAQSVNAPYNLVETVMQKTFARIKAEKASQQEDNKALEMIVSEELMPHVDHTYAGLYVLGSHAGNAKREQVVAYLQVFQRHLVKSYAGALKYYQQQEVQLLPSKLPEGTDMVQIKALVKEKGEPDIQVTFKVRRDKTGQWKAIDMIVEGVSLLQSKKSEFASVLRKDGLVGLTTALSLKTGS